MTERLYYHDARTTTFDATVVQVRDSGRAIVLDRTAFYPTSGGQPFDTGVLGEARVVDVTDEDAHIVHILEAPSPLATGQVVVGRIDWARRFDHMQQHTGQHLLSALLADHWMAPTVSVHFGAAHSTVDVALSRASSDDDIAEVERQANDIITSNVPVSVSFEDAAKARGLRKPSDRDGTLRIIEIAGIDRSACGGTHVSDTGDIGPLLIRRVERAKGNLRLEFLCGQRAIRAARADFVALQQLSRALSTATADVPALVEAQLQRVKELERTQRRLHDELADFQALSIHTAHAADSGGIRRIHLPSPDGHARDRQPLAVAVTRRGAAVVVVTAAESRSVLLATSEDSGVDAGKQLGALLAEFGGRGGGSPRVAQGTLSTADALDAIVQALGCTSSA